MPYRKLILVGIIAFVLLIASTMYIRRMYFAPTPKFDFVTPSMDINAIEKVRTDLQMERDAEIAAREKAKADAEAQSAKLVTERAGKEQQRELDRLRIAAEQAQKRSENLEQQLAAERAKNKAAEDLRLQKTKHKETADQDLVAKADGFRIQQLERLRANLKEGELLITVVIRNRLTTSAAEEYAAFKLDDTVFVPTQIFVGVTTQESVLTDQQRWISPRADGKYEFTITARSKSPGVGFKVDKGSKFDAGTTTLAGFIEAYSPYDAEGWQRRALGENEVNALKLASDEKAAALLAKAIPKYYQLLVTEYPDQAARKASEAVGGGQFLNKALLARFKVVGRKHQPPDTKLDREQGTITIEAFKKVVDESKRKFFELRPTSSTNAAAWSAGDGSLRIHDLLVRIDEPEKSHSNAPDPADLEVLAE